MAYKSTLISKNVKIAGSRTSVRLEHQMWGALQEVAKREGVSINDICTLIDHQKTAEMSLTSAIRTFLVLYFRAAATEEGHEKAGHGSFQKMMERVSINKEDIQDSLRAS